MKVVEEGIPQEMGDVVDSVASRFDVDDFVLTLTRAEFEICGGDLNRGFKSLYARLKPRGYLIALRRVAGMPRLLVLKFPRRQGRGTWLGVGLFSLTVVSTLLAGYFFLFGSWVEAAMFSSSLLLILSAHELGHKMAAVNHGVETSLPYFIPVPSFLGTLGAVMRLRSPPTSKDALVEMGAAGPIAGFLVALSLLLIGLVKSVPLGSEGFFLPFAPVVFVIFETAIYGHSVASLYLHPLAFAGWVALLITMFNLLPVGQLDGGHVARGMMSEARHFTLTKVLSMSFIFSGFVIPEFPLWLWGLLIYFFFRNAHPGALNDISGLSTRSKCLSVGAVLVFLLCLPVPLG